MTIAEKRALADDNHPALSIGEQCDMLGLARSSFYYAPGMESLENLRIMRWLDEEYMNHPFYGYRWMTAELNREGYAVNEKRVLRLMQLMGISAIYPKPNLSKGIERQAKYPYLLRGVKIVSSNHMCGAKILVCRR